VFKEYGIDPEFERAFGIYDYTKGSLFIASMERGEFQRFRFIKEDMNNSEGDLLIKKEDIIQFKSDVSLRNIEPIFLSEPVEKAGTLEGEVQNGILVKKIVADIFRDEIIRMKNDQLLMLCNDKEGCNFAKQTFSWLANLVKEQGQELEFVYMNADLNEVSGLTMARFPFFYLYLKDYKSKKPKDFDLPFNMENLASWLKTFVPNMKLEIKKIDKLNYTWDMSNKEDKVKIAQVFMRKDEETLKEFGEEFVDEFIRNKLEDYKDEGESD